MSGCINCSARQTTRASAASEPRERSAPAQRRASARAGESEGRSPSVEEVEKWKRFTQAIGFIVEG
jgi:hypothetical protein